MKTPFFKKENFVPKWYFIDAANKTLGRLSTEIINLLISKELPYYTPGIFLGNYIIVVNISKIKVTGKKELVKLYYKKSDRPGKLKIITYKNIKKKNPSILLERAINGMLPKTKLKKLYLQRLYLFNSSSYIMNLFRLFL